MLSYVIYELRSRRGSIIGWGIGVGFFVLMYSVFYPSLPAEMVELDFDDIQIYQALGNFEMATFEGYFGSTILNFMALLVIMYAVTNGTGTLAGEEETGTLELLVTLPLHRWEIVIGKAIAMAISAFLILGIVAVMAVIAFVMISGQIETTLTAGDLVLPVFNALPIVLLFMMMSLFFGAFMPQRRFAVGASAAIVLGSYFGNNLLPMIADMDAVTSLLPFHFYQPSSAIFVEGIRVGNALVLLVAALVFLLLAIWSFSQRNITTGIWFWRRGHYPAA